MLIEEVGSKELRLFFMVDCRLIASITDIK